MNKKKSTAAAGVYVRKSGGQSIGNQMKVIQKFAKRRGLKIVKVYADGENLAEDPKPARV
jgi:hypothetical protein